MSGPYYGGNIQTINRKSPMLTSQKGNIEKFCKNGINP